MKKNKELIFWLLFATIILGSLCFHNSAWYDETFELLMNKQDLKTTFEIIISDFTPFLYTLILKVVTFLFGHSVIICRLVSLTFVLLCFVLIWKPIKRIFNQEIAFIMSVLLITSKATFFAATEIRTYGLSMFMVLGSTVYLIDVIKNNKSWKLFLTFSILALFTHNYSTFYTFFLLIVGLIYIIKNKKEILKRYLKYLAIIIGIYIPWVIFLLRQVSNINSGFWITKPTLSLIRESIVYLFNSNKLSILFLIITILFGIYFYIKNKEKDYALIILLPILLNTFGFILVSLYKTPMFIPKYLVNYFGPIILFISILISKIDFKWLTTITLISLICASTSHYKYELSMANNNGLDSFELLEGKTLVHLGDFSLGVIDYYTENTKHIFTKDSVSYLKTYKVFDNFEFNDEFKKLDDFCIVGAKLNNHTPYEKILVGNRYTQQFIVNCYKKKE